MNGQMEARSLSSRNAAAPGKGVLVSVLPAGRTAIAAARPVLASAVRQHLLSRLKPREAKMIVDIARRLG
jgi:DNA-binding MarR family transcriptional regulator